jgi:hypothetical protein
MLISFPGKDCVGGNKSEGSIVRSPLFPFQANKYKLGKMTLLSFGACMCVAEKYNFIFEVGFNAASFYPRRINEGLVAAL